MSMPNAPRASGWLEVITGSMFSGKSEELIRRVRRAQIARQKVQLFKPRLDARYSDAEIVSHSEMVAIDEGQFFVPSIVEVADTLANRGLRVIVAGLDQDYRGRPFEPMPQLMAIAEHVDKTLAVCVRCGAPANRSQRLVPTQDRVVVGGAGQYEARCRRCFNP